jgi:nucleoside phosphorylase
LLDIDILLVTVTEIETNAVLQAFYNFCKQKHNRHHGRKKTYFDLGTVNGTRFFLVQSGMGNYGLGASLLTVQEAIQELKPSCVIMAGIAFGVNPPKQRIGDIVVAENVVDYESLRWGTAPDGTPKIDWRGGFLTSSMKLLDRFRNSSFDWPGQSSGNRRGRFGRHIHFGPFLSGQKLVDNIDLRNQLLSFAPGAIGGDMESFGVYVAAHDAKVDCITVKGISDFADGNKSIGDTMGKNQDQKTAADNAIAYVIHTYS